MKNILFLDANFTAVLLVNEEQQGNTITVSFEADDTETQSVTITKGETTSTVTITPETENIIQLAETYWNYGDVTTLTLTKDGVDAGTIDIEFPEVLDTDSSLTGANGAYRMQGSKNVEQQIVDLQETIESVSSQVVDYILPETINQNPIEDGDDADVLIFKFFSNNNDEKSSFYSCVHLPVETTVEDDTYNDCDITITMTLDSTAVATTHQTYGDGDHILMLNFLLTGLAKGNHTFTVNFAPVGGAIN